MKKVICSVAVASFVLLCLIVLSSCSKEKQNPVTKDYLLANKLIVSSHDDAFNSGESLVINQVEYIMKTINAIETKGDSRPSKPSLCEYELKYYIGDTEIGMIGLWRHEYSIRFYHINGLEKPGYGLSNQYELTEKSHSYLLGLIDDYLLKTKEVGSEQ